MRREKLSPGSAGDDRALDTSDVETRIDASLARAVAKVDMKTARAAAKVEAKTAQAVAKVDEHADRVAAKMSQHAEKLAHHAARGAEALDRMASHLEAVDLWTRSEPGARKPRLGRSEIASAAIRIADADGLDAVSMRRLAADLDVGTMTLYHYVHTKLELLAIMVDALAGEVVLPSGEELSSDWREAVTTIACRTRDVLRRHPWVLEVNADPSIGPNALRHFDQCWQAVAGLDWDLETKLDVTTAVDEYVFGFCVHEHRTFAGGDEVEMPAYIEELLGAGAYPAVRAITDEVGLASFWTRMHAHSADPERFERNLARLLDGFERDHD